MMCVSVASRGVVLFAPRQHIYSTLKVINVLVAFIYRRIMQMEFYDTGLDPLDSAIHWVWTQHGNNTQSSGCVCALGWGGSLEGYRIGCRVWDGRWSRRLWWWCWGGGGV